LVTALEPDVRASRLMAAVLGLALCCALGLAFPAFAGARIALVIGQANYQHAPALPTPAADAADVAAALSELGFTTTLRLDVDKKQLDQTLEQFARDAKTADAAIFYYAGDGLQVKGRNYLAPADAQFSDEAAAAELTAIDDVKAALGDSKALKILILDACRDNPFVARPTPSPKDAAPAPAQGLARDDAAADMIIAYAAKAGEIAREAEGRNSPFTAALLKALKSPGLEVGALFRRVQSDVAAATGGAQSPELAMSATPEYYLNASDTDQTIWLRIRNGRDVTALEDFIARFPKSGFVPDAIARIELIDARKRAPPEVAEAGDKTQPIKPNEDAAAKPPASAPLVAAAVPETAKPDLTPAIRDQLRRLSCFQGVDADWSSPAMQAALARYVRRAGRSVTGPDAALLETMKSMGAGLCRPRCSPRAVAVAGRCVHKTCAPGASLTRAGACVRPRPAAVALVAGWRHRKPCYGSPRCAGNATAVTAARTASGEPWPMWPAFATPSFLPMGRGH